MYGYGYRYNSGLVVGAGGGAPFANTKSLLFDGIDDYIELGSLSHLQNATEYSISSWFKSPLNNQYQVIWGWADGADGYLQLLLVDDGSFVVYNYRISQAYGLSSTGVVSADTWYNATVIFDGGGATNADRLKLYINGSLITLTYTGTIPTQTGTMLNKTMWLGASNSFNFWGWEGNIDEVSIFDSAISIGDVWDGSGQPTDLSLLSTPPTNWYRMGDNGAYKSPQWLLPNNENKDKLSNYSLELDGIDDYITASNAVLSSAGDMTISCWANFTSLSSVQGIFDSTNYYLNGFNGGFSFRTIGANLDVAFSNGTSFDAHSATAGLSTSGGWYHLAFTFDNTTKVGTFYKNGASIGTHTYTGFDNADLVNGGVIGRTARLNNFCFTGKLDEIVIFDSVKDATAINDIYNGGTPTTISGAIAHWRMGEEATFSGGLWTVPDNVGSNNGTSNAMTIDDRIGEAPSSENNALSFNMDLVDRVTDTP